MGEQSKSQDEGDNKSQGELKTDLSKHRSKLAKQRTLLAKQRTFSAWLRTGLATVAVGIALVQLLGQEQPAWLIQVAGGGLVGVGVGILLVGLWSYRRTFRMLQDSDIESVPIWAITVITLSMILFTLVILLVILV